MKTLIAFLLALSAFGQTVNNGGSGSSTVSSGGTNGGLYRDSTGAIVATATGGAGTLCFVSAAGGTPVWGSCAGSAATGWDSLTNPAGNMAINTGTFTSTWTVQGNTSTTNLFNILDTTGNTGTGSLFEVHTVGTSAAKPVTFTAKGTANGVQMDNTGSLAAIGTGGIVFTSGPLSGLTGAGTGVLTFLATPSSANFAAAVTDESGTGLVILQTSPTIVTPTIASFANATHNHTNAAGGGQITDAALSAAVTLAKGGTGADQSAIAKGGLLVGTAAGTIGIKAVGTDGQVLTADAASAGGMKWAAVSGSGTVTVVGAGSLTSTALVTGGGSQTLQTPAATATMDSSGNISTPGTLSSGIGSGNAGSLDMTAGTVVAIGANQFGIGVGATMTTSQRLQSPNAVAVAHSLMVIGAPTSNISTWAYKAVPDCTDTGGNHLNFTQSTDAFSCGTSGGSGLTVGSTAIGSGTTTRILYDNAGTLGEYAISGTGSVCMTTGSTCSPGTPGGTVVNKTANYTLVSGDTGNVLNFTISSAQTATMPATPPAAPWIVSNCNDSRSTANLTVARNGNTIFGVAANRTLLPGQCETYASDFGNTNYAGGFLPTGVVLPTPSLGTSYLSGTKTVGATTVTANLLVKIDTSGNVVNLGLADTIGALGIAASTVTTGNPVEVATRGIVNCIADNTTVIGNILLAGTNTAGRCLDSGQTSTTAISNTLQVIGKALTVATVGNPVSVQLYGPGHYGAQVVNAGIANGTIDLTTKVAAGALATFLASPTGANFNALISAGGVPIAQNSQSAAYTTVLADGGKHILHPTADNNARTFTIDSNANVAYPVGTVITFVNQINTLTIAITSDTLQLAGTATTGSRTLAAGGIATATKITTTLWFISGPGLT